MKYKFEIINELGVVSDGNKGWRRALNRISLHGKEPKYGIRDCAPDHKKMGKGITLTEQELRKLKELIDAEIAFLEEVNKKTCFHMPKLFDFFSV